MRRTLATRYRPPSREKKAALCLVPIAFAGIMVCLTLAFIAVMVSLLFWDEGCGEVFDGFKKEIEGGLWF